LSNTWSTKPCLTISTGRSHPEPCVAIGQIWPASAFFLLAADLRRPPLFENETRSGILGDLAENPDAWQHITCVNIKGFWDWMLQKGYALGTIDLRLATVKKYASLAIEAGMIPKDEWIGIQNVQGYAPSELVSIDEKCEKEGFQTRRSERCYGRGSSQKIIPAAKKAESTLITDELARQLKSFPDKTPMGRRNNLLMGLLMDNGLRKGEVASLRMEKLDLKAGTIRFKRPKVEKEQNLNPTPDTLDAIKRLLEEDNIPRRGPLVRRIEKNGTVGERALTAGG
jgi:integrase